MKSKWINALLEYLFMLTVVLYGQSMWTRMNMKIVFERNTILTTIAIVLLLILIILRKKVNYRGVITGFIIMGLIAVYYFFTLYGINLLFFRFVPLISLLCIYCLSLWESNGVQSFLKKYVDIVFVLALMSLFMYLFGTILGIIPAQKVDYYWADLYKSCTTRLHFLYEAQTENFFGVNFTRNCGIFCEAPSYAVPLLLATYYEMFVGKGESRFRLAVLLLTIVTTFSTKAFLILGIMISLRLLKNTYMSKGGNRNKRIMIIIIPIIIFLICFMALSVLEQKEESVSYISRMDNLRSTMLAFLEHPLFGVGAGNEDAVAAYSPRILRRTGFSIGATLLMAEGGIYLTVLYLYSFFRALKFSKHKFDVICIFVIYLAILFTSNIIFFLSTYVFLALGYTYPRSRGKRSFAVSSTTI